jgi:hypothetical protein
MSNPESTPENTPVDKTARKVAIVNASRFALIGTSLAAVSFLGAKAGVAAALTAKVVTKAAPEVIEVAKGFIK